MGEAKRRRTFEERKEASALSQYNQEEISLAKSILKSAKQVKPNTTLEQVLCKLHEIRKKNNCDAEQKGYRRSKNFQNGVAMFVKN